MQVIESILADAAQIAAVRRDIHAHPELCFEERRTADVVAQQLTDWGVPIHRGLGKTGIVAILKNGTSDRAVGLRADMDALPITEFNTFAHKSTTPGKMHACGHDGHTAMLLAAAKHLSKHRNYDGTVYLIFQPAEEGGGGAREMMRDGLFDKFPMEAVFGAHNWPGLAAGQFSLKSGPAFASSNEFRIVIHGKGSHAAMPHLGLDPVPVACAMVQAFQTIISRNKRPIDAGVISVTMIHTGEATNVVPDSCEIRGTVRTFTLEVLDLIERRMQEVAEHTCAAFGARCEFEFRRNYPPTINHPAETEFARRVMADMVGPSNVIEFEPTMGSEDFSYFLQEKPGCYFLIGNGDGAHREMGHGMGPCMLHNPSYDFNDELIPLGGSLWVRLAEAWLANHTVILSAAKDLDRRRGEILHFVQDDNAMSDAAASFSQTYAEARDKFFAAARARGLGIESHVHPLLGQGGEMLAMDVARSGPSDARSLLVVSSACHGIEGYCGSGVQMALLGNDAWHEAATRAGVAVLYIHALNPYGFSWWRRTTNENVDLNRNFRDFTADLPRNAEYDELAQDIVPEAWPPDAATLARIARYVAERGDKALQQAVSGGQYHHPKGLFYGGTAPTWSHETLRQVLRDHGRRCARLAWIDVHTGLGPSGHGERIFACRDDATAYARAKAWWGEVTSIYDGSSSSAVLTGLMWLAAYEECAQAEYTGIALEYGTVPSPQVIDALRADQWLENHPEADDATRRAIKQQVRDAFYTDTDAWKERVVEQAVDAAFGAVRGLSG